MSTPVNGCGLRLENNDKRGNPGTQAMVQAGANRVHMGGKGLIQ